MPDIQPTILVKKADGTTERVSLDEFRRKYRSTEAQEYMSTTVPEHTNTPTHQHTNTTSFEHEGARTHEHPDALPAKEGETHLATTAPVREIFVDEALSNQKSKIIKPVLNGVKDPKSETRIPKSETNPKPKIQNPEQIQNSKPKTENSYPASKAQSPKPPPSGQTKPEVQNQQSATKKQQWNKSDFQSLLEEDAPAVGSGKPAMAAPAVDLNQILPRLNFAIPADLRGRLESFIVSRIKNIRTDDQLREYFARKPLSGGLGLSAEQADQLVAVINRIFRLSAGRRTGVAGRVEQKKPAVSLSPKPTGKDLPEKVGLPAEETEPELREAEHERKPLFGRLLEAKKTESDDWLKPKTSKPILHDVLSVEHPVAPSPRIDTVESVEPAPSVTGPVDELFAFTLDDFFRLSPDPAAAAKILLNKFRALKEDSYLVFLQGVEAWRESPLYRSYQETIKEALNQGISIDAATHENIEANKIDKKVFTELLKVNQEIQ